MDLTDFAVSFNFWGAPVVEGSEIFDMTRPLLAALVEGYRTGSTVRSDAPAVPTICIEENFD